MQTPSGHGWTITVTPIPTIELWMSYFSGSVPGEAAWRFDRLKIGEIGIADCLQGIGCCALTEVFGQCVERGGILRLQNLSARRQLRASAGLGCVGWPGGACGLLPCPHYNTANVTLGCGVTSR